MLWNYSFVDSDHTRLDCGRYPFVDSNRVHDKCGHTFLQSFLFPFDTGFLTALFLNYLTCFLLLSMSVINISIFLYIIFYTGGHKCLLIITIDIPYNYYPALTYFTIIDLI